MIWRLLLLVISVVILNPLAAQTDVDGNFEHDGENRLYRVHLPPGYNDAVSLPLIINMHGFGSTNLQQVLYSNFNPLADAEDFIIVYPQGLEGTTVNGLMGTSWDAYFGTGHDDFGFLDRLIDEMYFEYNIDLSRVYSTGMSNGGFMSYRLACEMENRIAAIASVTGAMSFAQISNCDPDRPVPVLEIHGTSDLVVPFNGTALFTPSIPEVADFWVDYNDCDPNPEMIEVPNISTDDNTTTTAERYSCAENTEVWFYTVQDGGHSWPGAFPVPSLGNTSQDFSATELIWEFFERHTHPNPDPVVAVSTSELDPNNEWLAAFPNPFGETLHVRLKSTEVENLILRDIAGRIMLEKAVAELENLSINTQQLPTGLYFLEVQNQNQRFTIKLIKSE